MATKKNKTAVQIYNEKVLVVSKAVEERILEIQKGNVSASELQIPVRVKGEFGNNWIRPTDTERDHTLLAQCILDNTQASELNGQEFSFLHKCLRLKRLTEAERDRFLFKLANKHLNLSLVM